MKPDATRPVSPPEPLTAEEAVEKALLYVFQLSNKDYRKMRTALSGVAFMRALEQDGITVVPLATLDAARAQDETGLREAVEFAVSQLDVMIDRQTLTGAVMARERLRAALSPTPTAGGRP